LERGGILLPSGAVVFELKHVSFRYRPYEPALLDVSLTINDGDKVVILGPNGAGKTTLEKIMAGILPAEGRFSAFGQLVSPGDIRDRTKVNLYRRRVGHLFQDIEFHVFCATVMDEIMSGPLRQGLTTEEAKNRAEQMLEFCGIKRLIGRLPGNLSGGEKKMVAIAAMMAENPDVMIFDEPTNDLDSESQEWLVTALLALNQIGKTVVTATHNMDTARRLADKVVLLGHTHRLVAVGGLELMDDRAALAEAGIMR
jgi:cobalt/nickel transport system ATP-binding protein